VLDLDEENRLIRYEVTLGRRSAQRTGRAQPDEIAFAREKGKVPVWVSPERPEVSQLARSELPDIDVLRLGLTISAAALLLGFLASFLGASWEHIEPIMQARREHARPELVEVARVLHNLLGALAIVAGVAGAAGVQMAGGLHPFYGEHYIQSLVLLGAGAACLWALRRWSPFHTSRSPRR